MDIFEMFEYLDKKYANHKPKGYKLMFREDTDVYIYLPSPSGDGWYVAESYDNVAEFMGHIKENR